jgi:adenosylcobinamide-GDP ribazoletransferase
MSLRHGDLCRGGGRQSRVTERLSVLLADLLAAFQLLTRLPVARWAQAGAPSNLVRCVWAFPIVGFVVNATGGSAYWLANWLGVPPLLAAVWALVATTMVTGGLHDDGLADTADGFGGGATSERKLEIMRDSHIGTYGALVLVLSAMARVIAIASLGDPFRVAVAFGLSGMVGRSGILVLLLALRPVRDGGMGAAMGGASIGHIAAGLAVAVAVCIAVLPIAQGLVMIGAALGVSLALAKFARGQIGGYTGDVLGAAEVIVECVVLTVAASSLVA